MPTETRDTKRTNFLHIILLLSNQKKTITLFKSYRNMLSRTGGQCLHRLSCACLKQLLLSALASPSFSKSRKKTLPKCANTSVPAKRQLLRRHPAHLKCGGLRNVINTKSLHAIYIFLPNLQPARQAKSTKNFTNMYIYVSYDAPARPLFPKFCTPSPVLAFFGLLLCRHPQCLPPYMCLTINAPCLSCENFCGYQPHAAENTRND